MDFLEGALLGPLWSDTDYEYRSHKLLACLYILIIYTNVAGIMKLDHVPKLFNNLAILIWLGLTVFLMIVSTLMAAKYYHQKLSSRFIILATLFVKYICATGFLIACYRPIYNLKMAEIKDFLLNLLDSTVGDFVSNAAIQFRIIGLLVSGILSGLLVFIVALGFIILIMSIPILFLRLLRFIQTVLDKILLSSKVI